MFADGGVLPLGATLGQRPALRTQLVDGGSTATRTGLVREAQPLGAVTGSAAIDGAAYHPNTYSHYGADTKKYPAWGDLVWRSDVGTNVDATKLLAAKPESGSNPVSVFAGQKLRFSIVDPADVGYPQPGDGTVPACSGDAAFTQGGGNVKQSFRLTGFEHQAAYDNNAVRQATLYSINMLLQQAKVL